MWAAAGLVGWVGLGLGLVQGWRQRSLTPGVLVLVWFVGLSAAIATLETAFWQFKRYQMPLLALFFPLAGWGLAALQQRWSRWRLADLLGVGLVLVCALSGLRFAGIYGNNLVVLRDQQLAMALWVRANTPAETRLGVHDVGVLRYAGERPVFDVVGLTTPGLAAAWRQGPGTLYEALLAHPDRPGAFAIYQDVAGLPMLAEAGVFEPERARFAVPLPVDTVVSASATQVVSGASWAESHNQPLQPTSLAYLAGFTQLEAVNVAHLPSEDAADYGWWNEAVPPGFASQVQRLPYMDCGLGYCVFRDGLRVLSGGERFRLPPCHRALPNTW
ncbi:MAG: hypothetical protein HC915_21295 [Anaerolineae bacterium]|nr:hypothetical protein [Anaerolineae bacterium]